MVYVPTTWQNDQPPPIDETNLNKIEQGLVDAHAAALYARYFWGPLLPYNITDTNLGIAGATYLTLLSVLWPIIIDRIAYQIGPVSVGSIRAGIYREGATADSPVGAALVVESASLAPPAANSVHLVPISDTLLIPGQYFVGVQVSDATADVYGSFDNASVFSKYYNRAGGYGAFTDPCPTVATSTFLLWVGLRIKENHAIMS